MSASLSKDFLRNLIISTGIPIVCSQQRDRPMAGRAPQPSPSGLERRHGAWPAPPAPHAAVLISHDSEQIKPLATRILELQR